MTVSFGFRNTNCVNWAISSITIYKCTNNGTDVLLSILLNFSPCEMYIPSKFGKHSKLHLYHAKSLIHLPCWFNSFESIIFVYLPGCFVFSFLWIFFPRNLNLLLEDHILQFYFEFPHTWKLFSPDLPFLSDSIPRNHIIT